MYAKIQNSTIIKYPYTWGDFVAENNNTIYPSGADMSVLFPQTAAAVGGYSLVDVASVAMPTYDPATESCVEGTPVLSAGVWSQTWVIADLSLAAAQANKLNAVKQAYQTAIAQPVSFTTKAGVAKTYQADSVSVSNLQAALLGASLTQATPSGFYWVSSDNTQVAFEYADLQGLAATIFAQGATAFQHLQSLKATIAAATTAAAVRAVTW